MHNTIPHIMARTSIGVETETRERLLSYGRKGETYDELVNRLLDMIDIKGKS